jgi:hypothetical protein
MDKPRNPRRGQPRKDYLATLKKPKKVDWERLVGACIAAMIESHYWKDGILAAFPYTMKFPKDFPAKFLIEEEGRTNIYRINARKLYEWLYKHGYAKMPITEIDWYRRKVMIAFNRLGQDMVEELLDGSLMEEYNYDIELEEE